MLLYGYVYITVVHKFGIGHGFHHHLSVSQVDPLVMATTASCRILFFQVVSQLGIGLSDSNEP